MVRNGTRWFADLTITLTEDGDTLLTGPIPDQAALHGLLKKVRDIGIPLHSVTQPKLDRHLIQHKEHHMQSKQTYVPIILLLLVSVIVAGCQPASFREADTAQAVTLTETVLISERNTANVISLDPNHANSYRAFAPELPETLARVPQLDPETQLYVEEIEPNLFYVTGGIYQSAFLKTDEGVVILDAPPSFAHKLPAVIAENAPGVPITHLVYSHGHTDHVGGAAVSVMWTA